MNKVESAPLGLCHLNVKHQSFVEAEFKVELLCLTEHFTGLTNSSHRNLPCMKPTAGWLSAAAV